MRALMLYIAVAVAAPVYGGQVCPFMEGLPVWKFEGYVALPMVLILGLRQVLQPAYVDSAPLLQRSLRQFRLDMGLFALAGMGTSLVLHLVPGLPLWQSGSKLTLAFITGGLFASLDLALAREREVIAEAFASPGSMPPPANMFPRSKMFTLVAVSITVLSTMVLLLLILRDLNWLSQQPAGARDFSDATQSVVVEILLVMGLLLAFSVNLIFSASRNQRTLFEMETSVLESVSRGDLSVQVPVATQDEMGYIAGVTNTMITSLRDHLRLRRGLEIAAEVQRNFLPESAPEIEGLDMAGVSQFCEETGGDFYDFIPRNGGVLTVVGDVVGHGLEAALLMASTRSSLRQAAETITEPGNILKAVNRQLCRDTRDSGQFVTCVIMLLDWEYRRISWASAGHPPPIRYCRDTNSFAALRGTDLALGVDASWEYTTRETEWPNSSESVVLISDGVTEALGEDGMFGNHRLEASIARHASASAKDMATGIVDDVLRHAKDGQVDDDMTLVVVTGNQAPFSDLPPADDNLVSVDTSIKQSTRCAGFQENPLMGESMRMESYPI